MGFKKHQKWPCMAYSFWEKADYMLISTSGNLISVAPWSTLVIWYMQNEHLVALCEAKYATMLKFQQDSTRTSENRVNQAFKQVFIERIHLYHVYNMCSFCKPCRFIESLCFQASTVIIIDLLHICPSGPVPFSINIQSP